MKIRHRITYDKETVNKEFINFLREKKAKFDKSNCNTGVAYIYEEDEWKEELYKFLKIEERYPDTDAIYTKEEFEKAQWLSIRSKFRFEYPQPEEDFEYESLTYDDKNYCDECGCGLKQKDDFKIKKTPKWGRRYFFMLNWVEDELFANTIARECIMKAKITGLEFLDVIKYKKNISLEDIYQIYVERVLEPGLLNLEQSVSEVLKCSSCGKTKYIYSGKGLTFKKEIFEDLDCDIVKSYETFGDGHMCVRKIMVSKKFYQVIKTNKLDKDIVFEPITLI